MEAPLPAPLLDRKLWEDRIRRLSAGFLTRPNIYNSVVYMQFSSERNYLATSDGTELVQPSSTSRLVIQGETRADDGMELMRVEIVLCVFPSQLPSEAELKAKVDRVSDDLKALREAPVAEPYAGPALLSGVARLQYFSTRFSGTVWKATASGARFGRPNFHEKGEPALRASGIPHRHRRSNIEANRWSGLGGHVCLR